MDQNGSDDLDSFRRFIEDALDVSGLPSAPPEQADRLARLAANYGYVHRPEDYRPQLRQDIADVLRSLQHDNAGATHWAHYLTPLEQETRTVLQELILGAVQRSLPKEPSEQDLQQVIAYTLSVGWLVLASLLEKYAPIDDDGVDDEDL